METLFTVDCISAQPAKVFINPNDCPYIVVGYWPKGGYWKLWPKMYKTPDDIELTHFCKQAALAGWTNIYIVQLPDLPVKEVA